VNCYSEGDITTPFGGYKLSGFGGRDNSLAAHDQYTETKTIWINTSDDHVDEEIGRVRKSQRRPSESTLDRRVSAIRGFIG